MRVKDSQLDRKARRRLASDRLARCHATDGFLNRWGGRLHVHPAGASVPAGVFVWVDTDGVSRFWAWAAITGALAYVAIDGVLALADPQYSLLRNAESDYGVGPYAWLMDVNFLVRGAFSVAAIIAIAVTTSPRGRSRLGLALIGAWACCSALLALFPDNPVGTPVTTPGRLHLLLAGIAFAAVATGALLISLRIGADPSWRSMRRTLLVVSVLAIVAGTLAILSIRRPLADFGLYERIFLGLEILWIVLASRSAWLVGRSGPVKEAAT
jgi:hypothetical membrane protein